MITTPIAGSSAPWGLRLASLVSAVHEKETTQFARRHQMS